MTLHAPSYAGGFAAPGRLPILYPELWDGCVLALAPSLGSTGLAITPDHSGRFNEGTYNGGMSVTDGKFVFDGAGDYIDSGNTADALSSMTVAFRMKPSTQSSTYRDVIGKWGSSNYGWWVEIPDTAATKLAFGTSGRNYTQTTNSVVTKDVWNHITIVHDNNGTANYIYVNGVSAALTDTFGGPGVIGASTAVLSIGGNPLASRFFTGELDDIRILSRALTAAEVLRHYSLGAGAAYQVDRRVKYKAAAVGHTMQMVGVGGGLIGQGGGMIGRGY